MRLYLASSSPARLQLLRQAGVEPLVLPSRVDEAAALARLAEASGRRVEDIGPAETVQALARAKALEVAGREGLRDPLTGGPLDGFVLGGDSVFEINGIVHGKPHTPQRARERWLTQRGATGTLWSGHWLVDLRAVGAPAAGPAPAPGLGAPGPDGLGETASATVHFAADLEEAEIEAYIASGEPLEVAGAFTIDSLGGPFIDRVDGDPSTVVGLSLSTLRRMLRAFGVSWHRLWGERPAAPAGGSAAHAGE